MGVIMRLCAVTLAATTILAMSAPAMAQETAAFRVELGGDSEETGELYLGRMMSARQWLRLLPFKTLELSAPTRHAKRKGLLKMKPFLLKEH